MLCVHVIFSFLFCLDPVFPLNFLVQSWVPQLFDAIFQASFFSALLMFWLCVYHGIRQVNQIRV